MLVVGNRVNHQVLGIGQVVDQTGEKVTVKFANDRRVQFNQDEPSLSIVEKGTLYSPGSVSGLGPKMDAVLDLMRDGLFRTLSEISALTGYESLTGLSAGIRSLRKIENGGLTVDKRKREDSNDYEYRLAN